GPRVARTARVPCRVPGAPGGPKVALEFERCVIGGLSAENPDNATLERAPRFCLERTRLPAPWSCLGRTRLLGLPGLPGPSGRWGLRAHSRWGFRAHSPAGPPSSLPRGTSLLTPPLRRPTGWRRGSRRWGRGGPLRR